MKKLFTESPEIYSGWRNEYWGLHPHNLETVRKIDRGLLVIERVFDIQRRQIVEDLINEII